MAKDTYAGKIKNSGTQSVDALYKTAKTGRSTVKKGSDLRDRGGK